MEEKIKKYFGELNLGSVSDIEELTDGNSSNHLNYKVTTPGAIYVARVTKPGDLLSYTNLPDEYTILKQTEKHNVGPKAFHIDLEHFDTPILIEEFLDGVSLGNLKDADEGTLERGIGLLVQTSNIPIGSDEFPFKFTYSTYKTNFKIWQVRLEDIAKSLGHEHFIVSEFKKITKSAQEILEKKEILLSSSPQEFIYNDVHPGNMFWLPKENKAKFIDWQKVSIGDPTFMIALFARRFGYIWNMGNKDFSEKVLKYYENQKQIRNLEELFKARVLERATSDMIWSVWADIKKQIPIKITTINENKYYNEARGLILGI